MSIWPVSATRRVVWPVVNSAVQVEHARAVGGGVAVRQRSAEQCRRDFQSEVAEEGLAADQPVGAHPRRECVVGAEAVVVVQPVGDHLGDDITRVAFLVVAERLDGAIGRGVADLAQRAEVRVFEREVDDAPVAWRRALEHSLVSLLGPEQADDEVHSFREPRPVVRASSGPVAAGTVEFFDECLCVFVFEALEERRVERLPARSVVEPATEEERCDRAADRPLPREHTTGHERLVVLGEPAPHR